MKLSLKKTIYIGLFTLMIASVGGLTSTTDANAKVLRGHPTKRIVRVVKRYTRKHKKLSYKRNKKLYIRKHIKRSAKKYHKKHTRKHLKRNFKKHGRKYYKSNKKNMKRTKRINRRFLKQNKVNSNKAKMKAAFQHAKQERAEIGKQIQTQQQDDREIVNNELGGNVTSNNMTNTTTNENIYQKAMNDTLPQYNEATNNLSNAEQDSQNITTGGY